MLNIDLAPTLLELAGAPVPGTIQGRSWVPILKGEDPGRDSFLYEYYQETRYRPKGGYGGTPTILAVRTSEWKYITYPDLEDEIEELYHLTDDPDELHNLALEKEHAADLTRLKQLLDRKLTETGYRKPESVERSTK